MRKVRLLRDSNTQCLDLPTKRLIQLSMRPLYSAHAEKCVVFSDTSKLYTESQKYRDLRIYLKIGAKFMQVYVQLVVLFFRVSPVTFAPKHNCRQLYVQFKILRLFL